MHHEDSPDQTTGMSGRLEGIVAEFAEAEPRERLELLLEYCDRLPELPPRYRALRDAGVNRVDECQTPVFLRVELVEGRVLIHADVAETAPTVKGFLALLVDAFSGATPEEVTSVRPDLLVRLGLIEALGMVRMRGLSAILGRIRAEAARACAM
jgi:cysteine desulfuration protein SufE